MEKIVNIILGILTLIVLCSIFYLIYFGSIEINVLIDNEEKVTNIKTTYEEKKVHNYVEEKPQNISQNMKMNSEVIVKTLSGVLEGRTLSVFNSKIYAFIGIPYAEPPIGKLRFSSPEPVKPWTKIKKALKFSSMCSQIIFPRDLTAFNYISHNISEDCLTLNIWTPDINPKKLKTVMFWIHGGGFIMGSANLHETDGRVLSSFGDVVVVTVNYRVGVFGFLNTRTEGAPGNMGIYDQTLALHWVKDNIKQFGGDPQKLVPFGQSAGAISIGILMSLNKTKDLFSRAITQSGSFLIYEISKTFENSVKFTENVSCLNDYKDENEGLNSFLDDEIQCLKNTLFDKLFEAGNSFLNESLTTFLPSVDSFNEDFDSPTNYVQEEDAFSNLKELMSGLTRDEGTLLLLMMNPNLFTKYNYPKLKTLTETRQMFVDLARNRIDIPEEIASFLAKILIEGPETDSPQNNIRRLSNAFGNIVINCPTIHLADELIARNKTVYKYLFNYRPKSSKFGEWLGVVHYEEVPFVFGYPLRRPKLYTKRDIQFSKRIMKIWSHFAKTGEVLPQLDLVWPKYSQNEFYMVLQPNQSSIIQSFNQKYCQFYKTLMQINGR